MKNLYVYVVLHTKIKTCILSLLKGENTPPFLGGMQFWMLRPAWSFLHIAEPGLFEGSTHLLGEMKGKEKDPLFILLVKHKSAKVPVVITFGKIDH